MLQLGRGSWLWGVETPLAQPTSYLRILSSFSRTRMTRTINGMQTIHQSQWTVDVSLRIRKTANVTRQAACIPMRLRA